MMLIYAYVSIKRNGSSEMIGKCEYCNASLGNDGRVDQRFCSDDHRIKYHNKKRRIVSQFNKAKKAIDELNELAASDSMFTMIAQSYLRKLRTQVENG